MTEIAKALHAFYSGFDLPAYDEDSVPDDPNDPQSNPPYITYTVPQSGLFAGAAHQARIWYPTDKGAPSNVAVNAKADEVIAAIGDGIMLPAGGGYVCIYPGNPVAQKQPSDNSVRIVYLNLELRSYVRGERE